MRAEEPLGDSPVLLPGEGHAPPLQIPDGFRRAFRHHPERLRVGEQIALGERVGRMLLPGVFRIHGGQRGIDAACGQCRMGVSLWPLAYDDARDSLFSEVDRGAQPGPSGPYHQDGGCDLLFSASHVHSSCRRYLLEPIAERELIPTDSVGVAVPVTTGRGLRTTDYELPRVRFAVVSASLST